MPLQQLCHRVECGKAFVSHVARPGSTVPGGVGSSLIEAPDEFIDH